MKHRLMDLLACPVEKGWPLKLEIKQQIETKDELDIPSVNGQTGVVCRYYCNYMNSLLVEDDGTNETPLPLDTIKTHVTFEDCRKCFQIEIEKGTLYCPKNDDHKYVIKEGIPVMLTAKQIEELYGGKIG